MLNQKINQSPKRKRTVFGENLLYCITNGDIIQFIAGEPEEGKENIFNMHSIKKIQQYLLWASFIGTFAEQMITPLYGIFVKDIGGDILEAGAGFAIFSIITGLVIIGTSRVKWFNGHLKLIVLVGFTVAAFGDLGYYFVTGTIGLYIVQVIIGLSVGILNPAWEALYTTNGEEGEEHQAWSLWGGGANISCGLAAIVGSLVAHFVSFKAMFLLTGGINAVAIFFAYLVYRSEDEKAEG